ncbi:MAG: lysine transporter LysE [Aestuariivita sp.]|nr:lysine transporter LysE [Aestuariivita sp.]
MLTFTISVFLLVLTPGPAVLSLAGVGGAFGYRAGIRYLGGLVIGYHIVILAVVSGLASLILAAPWMRSLLLMASAGYLGFLAFHIAFAGSQIAFITPKTKPGLIAGVGLQLVNPKAYAVNTALISGFSFYNDKLVIEIVIKLLIMNAIWILLHLFWLFLGVRLNSLTLNRVTQRIINYSMASSLLIILLFSFLSMI